MADPVCLEIAKDNEKREISLTLHTPACWWWSKPTTVAATLLEAMVVAPAASIEAVEAAVLAVVTLTKGDAVKLEDAEVVCLCEKGN